MFNTRLKELYQMRGDVARLTICPPNAGVFGFTQLYFASPNDYWRLIC